ncbi:MAG: hypothetical protein AB1768_15345 [Pseudomonadota bacterium]|jgi:hypothetical protein
MHRPVAIEPNPVGASTDAQGRLYEFVVEDDPEWGRVRHARVIDTLGRMLRAGTITPAMHDAGKHFQEDFALAFADGYAKPRRDGLPAGTVKASSVVERHVGAARRVREALEAVGGLGSLEGSALWFVAGSGLSLREWARRLQ